MQAEEARRAARRKEERFSRSDVWCYVLSGAGTEAINGTYMRDADETRTGARVYVETGGHVLSYEVRIPFFSFFLFRASLGTSLGVSLGVSLGTSLGTSLCVSLCVSLPLFMLPYPRLIVAPLPPHCHPIATAFARTPTRFDPHRIE